MKNKHILNSPRLSELKRKRKKIFLNKVAVSALCVLLVFGFIGYISRISKLNISEVVVVGNTVVDSDLIASVANKEMEGNYLWLFPKSNLFFYPKDDIREAVKEEFTRLTDVDVSIRDRKFLEISVDERAPKYMWCGNTPEAVAVDGCYFMDEEGYIFDQAPYFSGEVYFKFYGVPSTISPKSEDGNLSGSSFTPALEFDGLLNFKETLEKISLKPIAIYKNDGEIKIYLSPSGSNSTKPEIMFREDADFDRVIENLQAALSTEPLLTNFKKKYSTLLYIDLRFGNKVYYKFK